MCPEELQDSVLSILSAASAPLPVEDICGRMRPTPAVRDVRIAPRELCDQGEALKDASQRWSAVAKTAELHDHAGHDFTASELQRARQRFGTTTTCPNCGKHGDIDRLFSWRRMHPEDRDLHPQSYCIKCRGESSRG